MKSLMSFLKKPSRRRDLVLVIFIPLSVAIFGLLLPFAATLISGSGYFCPLNTLFDIRCIGCGATRATICLAHGLLAKAVWYNPLYILLLIFPVYFYGKLLFGILRKNYKDYNINFRLWYLWILLAVGLVFMLVRNLPFYRELFY